MTMCFLQSRTEVHCLNEDIHMSQNVTFIFRLNDCHGVILTDNHIAIDWLYCHISENKNQHCSAEDYIGMCTYVSPMGYLIITYNS